MTDRARLNSVPKLMLPVYEKIVGLTNKVCDKHLNFEYRDLARAMTAALCRKRPSPLASGQPRTWACGSSMLLEGSIFWAINHSLDGRGQWSAVDLRDMPRDVQEIAFAKGLIPYIPADRNNRS
jgi:hypothetical protein